MWWIFETPAKPQQTESFVRVRANQLDLVRSFLRVHRLAIDPEMLFEGEPDVRTIIFRLRRLVRISVDSCFRTREREMRSILSQSWRNAVITTWPRSIHNGRKRR